MLKEKYVPKLNRKWFSAGTLISRKKIEKLKTELQHTEMHKETIAFEEEIILNANGNKRLEKNKTKGILKAQLYPG